MLHFFVDSRAQIGKFLFGVFDLVKRESINAMLLEYMSISRLMTHAKRVEGDNIKELAKDDKKA